MKNQNQNLSGGSVMASSFSSSISLYGNRKIGFSFIAGSGNTFSGPYNGVDFGFASATDALFSACDYLRGLGFSGDASVFTQASCLMKKRGRVSLASPPTFGSVVWEIAN